MTNQGNKRRVAKRRVVTRGERDRDVAIEEFLLSQEVSWTGMEIGER